VSCPFYGQVFIELLLKIVRLFPLDVEITRYPITSQLQARYEIDID